MKAEKIRVGYLYTIPKEVEDLPLEFYTHIIIGFVRPNESHELITDYHKSCSHLIDKIVQTVHGLNKKILISVGGGRDPFKSYGKILRDSIGKQAFIDALLHYVEKNNFDGVDFDFEGFEPSDMEDINAVYRMFYDSISPTRPNLSMSIAIDPMSLINLYDVDIINNCDFVTHMSYGFNNPAVGPFCNIESKTYIWQNEGQPDVTNASVQSALSLMLAKDVRPEKILGGIPFFTTDEIPWRDYIQAEKRNSGSLHPEYLEKYDPQYDLWVSDEDCIKAKISKYFEMNLGGIGVWEIGQDDPSGSLSQAVYDACQSYSQKVT